MSVKEIRAALETALNTMTPAIACAFENVAFSPVAGVPFQRVTMLFATPDNAVLGRPYMELGFMQVDLCYPLQGGTAAMSARAELIRQTFYRGASFTNSGVTVRIQKTPEVSPGSVDGERFIIPVKVRFFSNITS